VIWAFDVDATLVGSISADILRPGVHELLGALRDKGITCILWSAGGDVYAKEVATKHGIHEHFVAFYSKDERDENKRYKVSHFESHHLPQVFVDDSPGDMPLDADRVIAVGPYIGSIPTDTWLFRLIDQIDDIVADVASKN
jgi:cation transport ATPase